MSFSFIDVDLGIGFVNSEGDTGFPSPIPVSPFETEIMAVRFSRCLLIRKWKTKEDRDQSPGQASWANSQRVRWLWGGQSWATLTSEWLATFQEVPGKPSVGAFQNCAGVCGRVGGLRGNTPGGWASPAYLRPVWVFMEGWVPTSHLHASFLALVHGRLGCVHSNRDTVTSLSLFSNNSSFTGREDSSVLCSVLLGPFLSPIIHTAQQEIGLYW